MEEENIFALSERIHDHLNIMNFQKKFIEKKNSGQKIPSDYFALNLSPNDQFDFFKNLSKWLLMQCRVETSGLTSYSDPTTISTNLLSILENMGFEEASEMQPFKLKNGSGLEVCQILDFLVQKIFSFKKILTFKKPVFAKQEEEEEKGNLDELEEEEGIDVEESVDFEEEEDLAKQIGSKKEIIETNADESEWFRECERVSGRIKIDKVNDQNEWRMHIDVVKNYSRNIKDLNFRIKNNLENISENVDRKLTKITSNQNMLNNALSDFSKDLKDNSEKKKQNDNKIKNLSAKIKELAEEFNNLNNNVDKLMHKLKEQNNSTNNDEALLKMKKVIDELNKDLTKMDIRNGVLSNFISNKQFRDKRLKLENVLNNFEEKDHFNVEETVLEELN